MHTLHVILFSFWQFDSIGLRVSVVCKISKYTFSDFREYAFGCFDFWHGLFCITFSAHSGRAHTEYLIAWNQSRGLFLPISCKRIYIREQKTEQSNTHRVYLRNHSWIHDFPLQPGNLLQCRVNVPSLSCLSNALNQKISVFMWEWIISISSWEVWVSLAGTSAYNVGWNKIIFELNNNLVYCRRACRRFTTSCTHATQTRKRAHQCLFRGQDKRR